MEDGLNFNGANHALRERYMEYRQFLQYIRVRDLPATITSYIAFLLHGGDMYHSDWEETAYLMGVRNRYDMNKIKVSAAHTREIPLLLALENYLGNASFVQVVDALLVKERYDILSDLEDFVKQTVSAFPQPEDSNLHAEED